MTHELPKTYDPGAIEARWADYWVKEKLFSVKTPESATNPVTEPVFNLLLPPPNVTGMLHIGHMLEHTEIDIVIRWRRMLGFPTLWLPGTDHAGIATQMMVERQLASERSSRQKLGRERFIERVWEWKKLRGGVIFSTGGTFPSESEGNGQPQRSGGQRKTRKPGPVRHPSSG